MKERINQLLVSSCIENENTDRSASLLYAILLVMLVMTLAYAVLSWITRPNPYPAFIASTIMTMLWLVGLYLLRRGRVKITALGTVSTVWLMVTIVSLLTGGIASVVLLNYCIPILIASLTLGGLYGIGFATASILASLGMLYGALNGFMSPAISDQTLVSTWMVLSGSFLVIAVFLHLAKSRIRESLAEAQSSEKSLVLSNLELEAEVTERKRKEAELRESEERFRGIFENSVMGLYRTTPNGQILMANPALVAMLGYSSFEDLVKRDLEDTGYGAEYPRAVFKDLIERDGEVVGLESAWVRKDGSTVHIRESSRAIRDPDGHILYYEGTVEDITKRVHAEIALRDSEARYRSLFQESPISLWEEDYSKVKRYLDKLQGEGHRDLRACLLEHPEVVEHCSGLVKIVDVNQETLNLYRADSKEMLYDRLDHFVFPDSWDVFREELLALVNGSMRFEREIVQETLKGETIHAVLRLVVAPGYEETWGKVFVSILDITERRKIEAEREQLLAVLMRRSNQLLAATDVSKSTSTILVPEELMAQTVTLIKDRFHFYYVGLFLVDEAGEYAVLHAGTGQAGRNMLRVGHKLAVGGDSMIGQCVANTQARIALDTEKEAVHFENPYLPETRSEMALPLVSRGDCIGALTVQSTAASAFSAGDVAILQSMADQLATALVNARLYEEVQHYAVSLEDRVAERTAELAAVNQELEAFAYSVSHDLRAPLRSIDGFSQALLEDYQDKVDDTGKDYLRRVRAGSQRMGHLIDDLLKLSRLTRREMLREKVDLSALVRCAANELQQREPDRNVEFVLADSVVAYGDEHLLTILFENLLNNAWKFTSKHDRATIEFGVMAEKGEKVYYVRDNGAGFDMAYADKLFGAFQRLHAMTEFEGSGIGLATAQRVVRRHGGRIWAEGAVDRGATFYLTLSSRAKEQT